MQHRVTSFLSMPSEWLLNIHREQFYLPASNCSISHFLPPILSASSLLLLAQWLSQQPGWPRWHMCPEAEQERVRHGWWHRYMQCVQVLRCSCGAPGIAGKWDCYQSMALQMLLTITNLDARSLSMSYINITIIDWQDHLYCCSLSIVPRMVYFSF